MHDDHPAGYIVGAETDRPSEPGGYRVVLPVVLAAIRSSYGDAIRAAYADAGFSDIPRLGARALGIVAQAGGGVSDLAFDLGVSKQAASQLLDTLVLRGYLRRVPHGDDRRRLLIELTDRGSEAAVVAGIAVEAVDERIHALLGEERADAFWSAALEVAHALRAGHDAE